MRKSHDLPPIVLTPEGPYRRGDVVTARWSLTNYGDAYAEGTRLHFRTTSGYEVDHKSVRITRVEAEAAADAFGANAPGVLLGELAPGETITAEFRIRIGSVRSGDELTLQAVLSWPDGLTYLSPLANIELRLRPQVSAPEPVTLVKTGGDGCMLVVPVSNDGGIGEDVTVVVPRIGGLVPVAPCDGGECRQTIAVGPYDRVEARFEFHVDAAYRAPHVEIDGVRITSLSCGAFYLPSFVFELPDDISFAQSQIATEPGPAVAAGEIVNISVRIRNGGRREARDVACAVRLPEYFGFIAGSLWINHVHRPNESPEELVIPLVRPQSDSMVEFACMVASPVANGSEFTIEATVGGEAIASSVGIVESHAEFAKSENFISCNGSGILVPGEERSIDVRVVNCGTERSRAVRLRIDAPDLVLLGAEFDGPVREPAKIVPILRTGAVPGSAIDLGSLGAGDECIVVLRVAAPESFAPEATLPFACYLRESGSAEVRIGELAFKGRCTPAISPSSRLAVQRRDSLRLGQVRHLSLQLTNSGADVARGVYAAFDMPESLKIESVHGATIEDGRLRFTEIPAAASAEATIAVRVASVAAGKSSVTITPVIFGERITTAYLTPLVLPTESQAFLDECRVETEPVDEDAALRVRMTLKNIGDGTANRVIVHALELQGYALNSTTLDGRTYRDIRGASPLEYGFSLPPIAAGGSVELTYLVQTKAGDLYVPRFIVLSDDQDPLEIQGEPHRARMRYRFLPEILRSADPMQLPAPPPAFEPIDDADYRDEESIPVAQVAVSEVTFEEVIAEVEDAVMPAAPMDAADVELPIAEFLPVEGTAPLRFGGRSRSPEGRSGIVSALRLNDRRIERIQTAAELLLDSEVGLYRHLFAMRLLVPDRIAGIATETQSAWHRVLEAISDDLRAPMLKLVLPEFEPTLDWSETLSHDDVGDDVAVLLKDIPRAIAQADGAEHDLSEFDVASPVDIGNFGYLDADELPTVHHLNAVLPELIPTAVRGRADLSEALKRYKEALARNFRALVYMGDAQRHERMCKAPTEELDDALRRVAESLGLAVAA